MPMAQRAPRLHRVRPWTRADLARLPDDGNRYEVLDGALLVTPQAAFSHQEVATRVLMALRAYCAHHGVGIVVGPGAIPHGASELQPDVQVVAGAPALRSQWSELSTPLLVVEVLSDSTRRRDLGIKRDAYIAWGIPEYWVVDLDERSVRVWRVGEPAVAVITEMLRWQPLAVLPAFELELRALFADNAR